MSIFKDEHGFIKYHGNGHYERIITPDLLPKMQLKEVKKMTETQKILKMIENVNLDDTETLDEIDRWTWYLVNKIAFNWKDISFEKFCSKNKDTAPEYTRSRDAIKNIRPDHCDFHIFASHNKADYGSECDAHYNDPSYTKLITKLEHRFRSPILPSEELAELHATIQAIEYDKENARQKIRYR